MAKYRNFVDLQAIQDTLGVLCQQLKSILQTCGLGGFTESALVGNKHLVFLRGQCLCCLLPICSTLSKHHRKIN